MELASEIQKDDLFPLGGELAYKLLLALFPFLIFVLTVLGALNLDSRYLVEQLGALLPSAGFEPIRAFIDGLAVEKQLSLMSTGLITSLVSSSSGARAIVRGY